jgi:hypothetical protein
MTESDSNTGTLIIMIVDDLAQSTNYQLISDNIRK